MIKIAINGFGRIGRSAFKIAFDRPNIKVVAINDPSDHKTMAYLLKYDTVYGHYDFDVKVEGDFFIVNNQKIKVFSQKDPAQLPWKALDVDVVIESTGIFTTTESASAHIKAGAKAVVISAPAKDNQTPTFVLGVNDVKLNSQNTVISNASCTTNCISPIMKILNDAFIVKKSMMTTIHSYTNDQSLVDGIHKDPRRGRMATQNIIPTTTGAATATGLTIPSLVGKFDGLSIRVPTPVVSLSDITALISKKTTIEELNKLFIEASNSKTYENILAVTNEPLVSSDFIGSTYSAIIDLSFTNVVDGDLVKIIAWYDNEWGYSNRLVDMVEKFGEKIL